MCEIRDTSHLTKYQKRKMKERKKMTAWEAAGHYLVETVMCKLHCGTF